MEFIVTLICLTSYQVGFTYSAEQLSGAHHKDSLIPRIIDGYKAHRGQFPYQAALFHDGLYQCGGALISNTWVLTAAHCITDFDDLTKLYVELGAQTLNIDEDGRVTLNVTAFPHPDWDATLIMNDIGLLELSEPVKLTDYIKLVKLPGHEDEENSYTGKGVQISGWGLTSGDASSTSTELNYLNLTVISNEECESYYGEGSVVTNSTLCTSNPDGQDICTGDSGGPLVIPNDDGTFTHIGVVSFIGAGCVGPGGYTRVASYLDWISEVSGIKTHS